MARRVLGVSWLCTLLVAGSCIGTNTDRCPSGTLCRAGTQCVIASGSELCVSPDAITECAGIAPDDPCPSGLCYASEPGPVCLAPTCGNGFVEVPVETCDDGNTVANDGCSTDCRSDETCPNGVVDPQRGELCDDGNAWSHDGCASGCVPERPRWREPKFEANRRARHAMVFDARRGHTVLFGGEVSQLGIRLRDTAEWNGRRWLRARPGSGPSTRADHAMAYDDVRGVTVLFGGEGLADTWEWNGIGWEFRDVEGPSPRGHAAMAFDRARRRVVLFGGRAGASQTASDETWEWDGSQWVAITTARRPPPSAAPTMAYDPVAGRIVLVGDTATWAFDGSDWTEIVPSRPATLGTLAAAFDTTLGSVVAVGGDALDLKFHVWALEGSSWIDRGGTTMFLDQFAAAFDSLRGRLVVYGGIVLGIEQADVHEWDGTTWTLHPGGASSEPAAGTRAAIANELRRHRVVMFGGRLSLNPVDETWTFDGITWTRHTPTSAPAPRSGHDMAYDAERDQVVLFGGTDANGVALGDTWIWDGVTWIARTPLVSPPPRTAHVLAYDAKRQRVVLFGGAVSDAPRAQTLSDTWEWDGTTWIPIAATGPTPRRDASLAYDPVAGNVVLFGGEPNNDETWTFDGSWHQQPLLASPLGRYNATLTSDAGRGRLILFGGQRDVMNQSGPTYVSYLADAWEWDGVSSSWREIPVETEPALRSEHVAFTAPDGGGIQVFGGRIPSLGLSGQIHLAWEGLNPEETCRTRLDVDGDGLSGCADPDCWPRCAPVCPTSASCASSPHCGDGTCDALEDSAICAADCGPPPVICGDAVCDPNEVCIGDCLEP